MTMKYIYHNNQSLTLDEYLTLIGTYPLPSPEEENELARRIQAGDKNAEEILYHGNLRFVPAVMKTYLNDGLPVEDLIMAGNDGLRLAIGKFDPDRGYRFIAYAIWCVRKCMVDAQEKSHV